MKLTPIQKQLVKKLKEHKHNRVLMVLDHLRKSVFYMLQFWEGEEVDYIRVNPRTIESMLKKEVLELQDDFATIELKSKL